ncbi:hypothetical protein [Cohnella abietis]|uniref:Uncharacterized protein n=1 Tax=Cohnella abietis TaxID=2507935 RepID=A0A3T1CYB3_9BACL|nr:hypothetical protein [Cohnella abietis]BBI30735.1 hypothetical protein KCTCHS21_01340 [Cohnella abietis]
MIKTLNEIETFYRSIEPKELYTKKQIQDGLGCHRVTRYRKLKGVPTRRINGLICYKGADLIAALSGGFDEEELHADVQFN